MISTKVTSFGYVTTLMSIKQLSKVTFWPLYSSWHLVTYVIFWSQSLSLYTLAENSHLGKATLAVVILTDDGLWIATLIFQIGYSSERLK